MSHYYIPYSTKWSLDYKITKKQEVLGRTNNLLSFNTTWIAQKTKTPEILRCRRNVFTNLLSKNDMGTYRLTHRLSFHTTRTRLKMTLPTIFLLLGVFDAAGTSSPGRCLSMKEVIYFTEPLPSNDRRDTHTDTQTDGRDL
jgi:hypothetical protein